MKKVLKLILLVAMISSLCVCAFAAGSPELQTVPVAEAGASELTAVTAEVPENVTVEVSAPVAANVAAAEQSAKAADPDAIVLDSFEITTYAVNAVGEKGEKLEGAATVTATVAVPSDVPQDGSMQMDLYENGTKILSQLITGAACQFTFTPHSTYTPVIVKAAPAGQTGGETTTPVVVAPQTSPQTMQSILPFALVAIAVLAIAGAVYARKRSFN